MKLIQTKEYLYLIGKEAKIKKGDLVAPRGLASYKVKNFDPLFDSSSFHYKVIAYFPLTKDSKELNLPLLPNPFENSPFYNQKWEEENQYKKGLKELKEDSIESFKERELADNEPSYRLGYVYGAKAAENRLIQTIKDLKVAQSKQFSLEDIQRAIRMAKDSVGVDNDGETCYSNKSDEEIIQSLSTQQLPKEFEPEVEQVYASKELTDEGFIYEEVFKTITNSEGKEVIQGTYRL